MIGCVVQTMTVKGCQIISLSGFRIDQSIFRVGLFQLRLDDPELSSYFDAFS